MYLPIEYTENQNELISFDDLNTYWQRYEILPRDIALSKFRTFIYNYNAESDAFVGWRWRQNIIDEEYQIITNKLILFFEKKIPQFSTFVHAYKNFCNFCIDYNYLFMLILQKSNKIHTNYVIFSLFQNKCNRQDKRINGEWREKINFLNLDSFLIDCMDCTHLGLGLAAIFVFMNENYLRREDVADLIKSFFPNNNI
jgi:hypothetical protein